MEEFAIYLSDLKPEVQAELIEFLGHNNNLDIKDLPITVIFKEDD